MQQGVLTSKRVSSLAELSDLYSQRILEIAGNPPPAPRLRAPNATARRTSRICGSSVEVDIVVEDGVITAYGHSVRACALGQTSAAIVAREIVGTGAVEFRELSGGVRQMLASGAAAPDGRWEDLRYLAPVRDYPNRHASTLLVFDAVVAALDELERRA